MPEFSVPVEKRTPWSFFFLVIVAVKSKLLPPIAALA